MIKSLGWIFGPLLLAISVALVALCVLLALDLRMSAAIPPGFVDEFTDTVNKRKFKEAFDMARNDPSFLGQVLTAGMSRLQYGLEDAREAAMNTLESDQERQGAEEQLQRGDRDARADARAGRHGVRHDPVVLGAGDRDAGEPGEAGRRHLARPGRHALRRRRSRCPAIFFNAFFRNRITRVTMDVGHIADDLLTQMYHNSKKPAAAAPPPAPAAPARRRGAAAAADSGQ